MHSTHDENHRTGKQMNNPMDVRKDSIASVDETIASLKMKPSLMDTVSDGKVKYTIETYLKTNHRKWYFCSSVKCKGKEVINDETLSKVEHSRKRVTQTDKTKILWNLFVGEAAKAHIEKRKEIDRRLKTSEETPRHSRKLFVPLVTGVVIIVLVVYGLYICLILN